MEKVKSILQPFGYFASTLYTIEKPEFLEAANAASDVLLEKAKAAKPVHDVYPSVMTEMLTQDERIGPLAQFIAESAFAILDGQGYNMNGLEVFVSEIWTQEHHKGSGMEQHVHMYGSVISGFYFLNDVEGGCMAELHDPRPGKVQASLPLKDPTKVLDGNNSLFVQPKAGLMVFTNSWLPHSFTRNNSDTPVRFVHFNVSVRKAAQAAQPQGPIIV